MPLSADRKLDVLGVVLAILVVAGIGLAVFGALDIANEGPGATPSVNFTADRINDTHVEIVHDGGDVIRGDEIVFTLNGGDRLAASPFPPSVREGDSAVLRADPGDTVRVHWTGGRGTRDFLDEVTV